MYTSPLLLQLKSESIRDAFHSHPAITISLSGLFLLPMLSCPLILRALLYLWPLQVSTGICLTAFYLFFQSQNHARAELLLIKVGKVEHVVEIRVAGEAKFGVCSDHVKVDCFLVEKSQMDGRSALIRREESRIEGFHQAAQEAHRAASATQRGEVNNGSVYDDDTGGASHSRADNLAECLWNCYFGSCSRWHYEEADPQLDVD